MCRRVVGRSLRNRRLERTTSFVRPARVKLLRESCLLLLLLLLFATCAALGHGRIDVSVVSRPYFSRAVVTVPFTSRCAVSRVPLRRIYTCRCAVSILRETLCRLTVTCHYAACQYRQATIIASIHSPLFLYIRAGVPFFSSG